MVKLAVKVAVNVSTFFFVPPNMSQLIFSFKLVLHREDTYKQLPAQDSFEHRLLFWSILHAESRLVRDVSMSHACIV